MWRNPKTLFGPNCGILNRLGETAVNCVLSGLERNLNFPSLLNKSSRGPVGYKRTNAQGKFLKLKITLQRRETTKDDQPGWRNLEIKTT
jgi:hypothetical protein